MLSGVGNCVAGGSCGAAAVFNGVFFVVVRVFQTGCKAVAAVYGDGVSLIADAAAARRLVYVVGLRFWIQGEGHVWRKI